MSHRTTRAAVAAAAFALAAAVGLAAAPAQASGTVTFSELIPATPAYALGPVISTGACDVADAPAKMTREFPVEWPEVAAAQGVPASEAVVLINLDSRGTLTGARIDKSSGNQLLDDEALLAIRNSTYSPEVQHCNRYARDYFIDVMFK